MHVQVKHGLSRPGTVIDVEPIGIGNPLIHRDPVRRQQQVAQQQAIVLSGIRQHGDRLFGDDEDMDRGLGIDVPEGQTQVIFINDIGGDFAFDYLAEQGVGHRIHGVSVPSGVPYYKHRLEGASTALGSL